MSPATLAMSPTPLYMYFTDIPDESRDSRHVAHTYLHTFPMSPATLAMSPTPLYMYFTDIPDESRDSRHVAHTSLHVLYGHSR
ncbi:hypothetical protein DPMN_082516 [Dreissena polymorpha]|uniref:Uncharacterized protein n=1 Tax=Dreissena polymorpha TaxID=45954 RepID=A0A9D4BGW8_DREPO|nr:hypothetical protein DPMN_082516 [Dreissena polymorpha]